MFWPPLFCDDVDNTPSSHPISPKAKAYKKTVLGQFLQDGSYSGPLHSYKVDYLQCSLMFFAFLLGKGVGDSHACSVDVAVHVHGIMQPLSACMSARVCVREKLNAEFAMAFVNKQISCAHLDIQSEF